MHSPCVNEYILEHYRIKQENATVLTIDHHLIIDPELTLLPWIIAVTSDTKYNIKVCHIQPRNEMEMYVYYTLHIIPPTDLLVFISDWRNYMIANIHYFYFSSYFRPFFYFSLSLFCFFFLFKAYFERAFAFQKIGFESSLTKTRFKATEGNGKCTICILGHGFSSNRL